MFEITLVDHLRLTFGHIVSSHRLHAEAARLHARRSRMLKGGEALLVAATAITAAGAASGWGLGATVAAALFAGFALVVFMADLVLNLDRSAQAHFQSAVQFWSMRERYRALLADLHDGAIKPQEARAFRNALLEELRQIHEATPPDGILEPDEAGDAIPRTEQAVLASAAGD